VVTAVKAATLEKSAAEAQVEAARANKTTEELKAANLANCAIGPVVVDCAKLRLSRRCAIGNTAAGPTQLDRRRLDSDGANAIPAGLLPSVRAFVEHLAAELPKAVRI
jgi:hypothetical protein